MAAFSGVNGKIAFQSSRTGGCPFYPPNSTSCSAVYVMEADGREVTRLSKGATFDTAPAWSPDGARIAFTGTSPGTATFDLYLIGADGTGHTPVTVGQDHGVVGWSNDGRRLIFSSSRDGNSEIYTARADGTGLVRLTFDPREDDSPAWSPDGTRIAFTKDEQVWLMFADGGAARPLTAGTRPDWAPDATRIAFVREGDIYTMDSNGGGVVRLTSAPEAERAPAWSPDGTRIAFEREGDIFTMNRDGTGLSRLTTASGVDINPDWQPLHPPPPPAATAAPGPPPAPRSQPSGCVAPPCPTRRPGRIRSPIQTLWATYRSSAQVLRMDVRSVPAGTTVQVRCRGRGCPFKSKTKRVRRRAARVALHRLFGRSRLRAGTVVEVRVTRPGTVGKVNRYTIRSGRKLPRNAFLCLRPGAKQPSRRC
jgi:Tol biopolymer transport system component